MTQIAPKTIRSMVSATLLIAATWTAAGNLAFAAPRTEQSPKEQPVELDKMLVTAGLQPISINDVASSVTVITRDEIEQKQARYLSELLRDVPGFAVSQSGGPGTLTQVRVRGAEANQLLVLIDGVRANDPAQGDEFPYQYALTADIERIEIIRGPQSATWGSDAMAGVINIIHTKKAPSHYLAGTLEGGSFSTRNANLDGGYSNERLQINVGFSYLDSNGSNISRQGHEKDGAENTTFNAAVDFAASDALTLHFSGQAVDATSEFDDIDFLLTGLPVDADRLTRSKRNYLTGKLLYKPKQSPFSGTLTVNWRDSDNKNFSAGLWSSKSAAQTLEFRLRGSLAFGSGNSQNHRISVSVERQDIDFSQRGIASDFGDPNQNQSNDVNGYALEYVGSPYSGFSWTLSGRLDDYSDFDTAKTWRIAGSQQLLPGLRLRASLGTGSKTPTFTERFGFFEDFFIGNPELKPESSLGWEIGIDSSWAQDRYRLQLAYFNQDLRDEIDGFVFDPQSFLFTASNKQSDSTRQGLEALLDTRIGNAVTLNVSYTYTDASEKDAAGRSLRELRRPRQMASLSANYGFASERGNLNLNLNYNGQQLDNFFSPLTFKLERVKIPSFTVVDMAVAWKLSRNLELTARVNNLFDEQYEEVLGFVRPGRAFYTGLRGRFERQ